MNRDETHVALLLIKVRVKVSLDHSAKHLGIIDHLVNVTWRCIAFSNLESESFPGLAPEGWSFKSIRADIGAHLDQRVGKLIVRAVSFLLRISFPMGAVNVVSA